MDTSPQIEPASTARLLTCLGLAIDETKLARSIKSSREMIKQLEASNPSSHRLLFLKREISNLEARLTDIRNQANRMQAVPKSPKFR
jgi:predicted RNase H-like nuclease (RuvC/YqgF family)